ncbi:MAG: BatD family protein [Mariprofundaceae bacterium]
MMLFLVFLALPQYAVAEATATLDRSISYFGESVRLSIHVNVDVDEDPNLVVLEQDFDILGQNQSSQYSLINGSMKRNKTWHIQLMPKHAGHISIAPISLGNVQTQALSLQVLPQNQAQHTQQKDVYLEVSVSPRKTIVQAQLLLTVKLSRAVNFSQAQLSEPELKQAIIRRLGKDKNYETVRDQRRFVVTERQYAIFPQQSGLLHIPAVTLTAQKSLQSGSIFQSAGQMFRIQSQALDIECDVIPTTWPSQYTWLPSNKLTVREINSDQIPEKLKFGEPITRIIEIRAQGLRAEQLPALLPVSMGQGFKQYPDKPELITLEDEFGVTGIRREKIAMIPIQAGDLSLPGLKLAWWNLQSQEVEYAQVLARTVSVGEPKNAVPVSKAVVAQSQYEIEDKPLSLQKGELENIRELGSVRVWQAIAAGLSLGWLLTLLWIWRLRRKSCKESYNPVQQPPVRSLKSARKSLQKACDNHDAHSAALALLVWASCFLKLENITHFDQLKGQSELLDQALDELNIYLYGMNQPDDWHGQSLWKAIDNFKSLAESESCELLRRL